MGDEKKRNKHEPRVALLLINSSYCCLFRKTTEQIEN